MNICFVAVGGFALLCLAWWNPAADTIASAFARQDASLHRQQKHLQTAEIRRLSLS